MSYPTETPKCNKVSKLTDYQNLAFSQAVEKLGQPAVSDQYFLSERQGEFYVGLQNKYPLTNPENSKIRIKELIWKYSGYNVTLWFHKVNDEWVVLEALCWPADTDF